MKQFPINSLQLYLFTYYYRIETLNTALFKRFCCYLSFLSGDQDYFSLENRDVIDCLYRIEKVTPTILSYCLKNFLVLDWKENSEK